MLNYHINPAALRSRVPRGTKLDSWNGKTFVSLVGFMFLNTKLLGVPVPFHRHFEEVNLRFYVRSRGEEGWRRGGVFVKEIVSRWAIAAVARLCYGERYVCVPMRHRIETDAGILRENGAVTYEWRHHAEWSHLEVRATGQPAVPQAGSEEEFITEHHWGYAVQRSGGTVEYRVEHPQWRVWQASSATLQCDARTLYASEFHECLSGRPSSVFLTEGSAVTVNQGTALAMLRPHDSFIDS